MNPTSITTDSLFVVINQMQNNITTLSIICGIMAGMLIGMVICWIFDR